MPEELVRVMIRLTLEQHEWLRKYCFDNRISQAEVLRQALELYRQELAKKERSFFEKMVDKPIVGGLY